LRFLFISVAFVCPVSGRAKLVDGAEPCSAQVAQNANAGLAVAASRFAQKRTAGAQQQLLDPMCGLCRVQGATSHIAVRFLFDHEEANQYIDSGQCDEYLLVHDQIRTGVRSDVAGGC